MKAMWNIGFKKFVSTLFLVSVLFAVFAPVGIGLTNYGAPAIHANVLEAADASDSGGWGGWILDKAAGALSSVGGAVIGTALSPLVVLSNMFLAIASSVFESVIDYTILNYASHFGPNSKLQNGISTVWTAFRDLANIALIGIFVYIAFMVMLNVQGFAVEKFVVRVFIVALLINFSLFFTKLVIDASNIAAIQFYNQISINGNHGVGAEILKRAGMLSISDTSEIIPSIGDSVAKAGESVAAGWNGGVSGSLAYIISASLLASGTMGIMLYAIILLFTRAIAFIFLMVTSPLAFAAFMVPQMEKYWKRWWSHLVRYALFAPLFMIMLWATLQITEGLQGDAGTIVDLIAGKWDDVSGPVIVLFNTFIILGLLYASVNISSKLSLAGTNWARTKGMGVFGGSLKWLTPLGIGAQLAERYGSPKLNTAVNKAARGARWAGHKMNVLSPRVDKKLDEWSNKSMRVGDSKMLAGKLANLGIATKTSAEKNQLAKNKLKVVAKPDLDRQGAVGAQAATPPDAHAAAAATKESDKKRTDDEIKDEINTLNRSISSGQRDITRLNDRATDPSTNDYNKKRLRRESDQKQAEISRQTARIEDLDKEMKRRSSASNADDGAAGDGAGVDTQPIVSELQGVRSSIDELSSKGDARERAARVERKRESRSDRREAARGEKGGAGLPPGWTPKTLKDALKDTSAAKREDDYQKFAANEWRAAEKKAKRKADVAEGRVPGGKTGDESIVEAIKDLKE